MSERTTFFVSVALEDIEHVYILVVQGTLEEVLQKVRYLARRTGATCVVHTLQRQPKDESFVDHNWKAMTDEGTVLFAVARVNVDYAGWIAGLSHQLERLPKDQAIAEIHNLQSRLDRELAALELLVETVQPQPLPEKETTNGA